MDNRNRFIKLLTISVDKQDLLLHGFSVPTEQATCSWKKKRRKERIPKYGGRKNAGEEEDESGFAHKV